MTKLIIENRMNVPDWIALIMASKAAKDADQNEAMPCAFVFGGTTVHVSRNAMAQTFVVVETERVPA